MTQTDTPVNAKTTDQTWRSLSPDEHDVRLVVCDMDGTLLDPNGRIPAAFWPLLDDLDQRGIAFVPASGRQYPTLSSMFPGREVKGTFIAENGTLVMRDGETVSMTCVDQPTVQRVITTARAAVGHELGLVVCGRRSAYVERTDEAFLKHVREFYLKLEFVDDLTQVRDDVLKVAIFDFDDPKVTADEVFGDLRESHQVVISAKQWIDIMAVDANKGHAVRALQERMGITAAQTVAFGDYFNDLEMLDAAELSFAIGNARPEIRARARYLAPTNAEAGVLVVLDHLLGR